MVDADTAYIPRTRHPAAHHKKTYTLDRLADDLVWLARHLDDLAAVYLGERISDELREEIMAAVSYENACRWCSFMHSEWARNVGVDADELRSATELEPGRLTSRRWAAVVYARKRAAADFGPLDDQLDRDLGEHWDARSRDLIEALARMMTTANLVANTFDALLSRLGGEALPQSPLLDEVVISALFLVGLPPASVGLAVMRRYGPLELLRQFRSFSQRFERRVRDGRIASVR